VKAFDFSLSSLFRATSFVSLDSKLTAFLSLLSVAIIYTPITLLHVLLAIYLEYWGRPIGVWSLSSKLLFTSLDLLSISLWSSLLSLSLSDLLSTPLTCVTESARWWTTIPVEDIDFQGDHNVCSYQIALVVTVAVGTVGFLVNFFVSLGRVLAKVLGRR